MPYSRPDRQHGLPAAAVRRAQRARRGDRRVQLRPRRGQQRRDRVHVAPRDVAVGELAVDAHAVEGVLAEQVRPDHRARDQPAHGRVQAGGGDQLVGARGEQLADVPRVGEHAQRGRDPRPALRGDVLQRLAQLAHDRALARPAVDEDERLVPVARDDVLERAPVDPAAAHDRDAVVRRVHAAPRQRAPQHDAHRRSRARQRDEHRRRVLLLHDPLRQHRRQPRHPLRVRGQQLLEQRLVGRASAGTRSAASPRSARRRAAAAGAPRRAARARRRAARSAAA